MPHSKKNKYTAICYNKKTNHIYRHISGNKFKNLTTGAEGEMSDEIAQKVLTIGASASDICNKHPLVEELISRLKLKIIS